MKVVVLGNSATAGDGLEDRSLAWPFVSGRVLQQALGVPLEIDNVTVFAKGPRAAGYALSKVEAANPDIVIVSLGAYLCSVRVVAEQVRHLFGDRAARQYLRLERRFDRKTATGSAAGMKANRAARSLIHRIIGARPTATVDEVVAVWEEVLHRLARIEGTQTIVFTDPRWPAQVAAANKGAQSAQDELFRRVKLIADSHRFPWSAAEDAFALAPDRDALYLHDGVHKSIEGHRVQAQALLEVLRPQVAARATAVGALLP